MSRISCQTGDVIKSDKNAKVNDDDDVKRELPASDVTQSAESATNQTSEPEPDKDRPTAARSPEVARHGDDKMAALLEVSSLGDREPGVVMSPTSPHVFSARTCAVAARTSQPIQRVGPPPLHRHVTPLPVMTPTVHLPRLFRYPPPPPPPPPLPGHVMRLFGPPSSTTRHSTCSLLSAASTPGRPVRFPRMGHTGLATNNTSHRMTLQAVRPPQHFQP